MLMGVGWIVHRCNGREILVVFVLHSVWAAVVASMSVNRLLDLQTHACPLSCLSCHQDESLSPNKGTSVRSIFFELICEAIGGDSHRHAGPPS